MLNNYYIIIPSCIAISVLICWQIMCFMHKHKQSDSFIDNAYSKFANITESLTSLQHHSTMQLQQLTDSLQQRLTEGLERNHQTINGIASRLGSIDKTQENLHKLSTNILNLQNILADKRARGYFGEQQLEMLLGNLLPSCCYKMQYTLTNGYRADCCLLLPEPTKIIAIDSKFPLENFQRYSSPDCPASDITALKQQFKQDLRHHVLSIAEKYINPPETSPGALLFIPAETVFAEIHNNYPEIISLAQKHQVWLASPSTLMAILTTVNSVCKEHNRAEQVEFIHKQLSNLSQDFKRLTERLAKLKKHFEQSHNDLDLIQNSTEKLTKHFHAIEQANFTVPQVDQDGSL